MGEFGCSYALENLWTPVLWGLRWDARRTRDFDVSQAKKLSMTIPLRLSASLLSGWGMAKIDE